MIKRASGVLINVSSLNSEYGIGGFGKEIENLTEFLLNGGFKYWQVLPLTTIGMGNSPYSGVSAFALNSLYVDGEELLEKGYVTLEELNESKHDNKYVVDYKNVIFKKNRLLKQAYAKAKTILEKELKKFAKENSWANDYALFMSLKNKFNNAAWSCWPKEYKFKENIILDEYLKDNFDLYNYYVFEQYVLGYQWEKARKICNDKGIKIIGDMPMYVCYDSADCWANREYFQLDKKGRMKKVAGVPPDYFSEDGQLWGNPLYEYKTMKLDGYKWWQERIDRMMQIYDVLRIDHFRAFSNYWSVDANATTAKNGVWKKGVGYELFEVFFKKYSKDRFIAEDLGIIDDKVVKLLKKTGLMGMRVMHFGFSDENNIHHPMNYTKNCVGYTATHDNNTSLGWLFEMDEKQRDVVLDYIKCPREVWGRGAFDNVSIKLMIQKLMQSDATLTIVPIQDIFGFGSDCRMNTPGVAEGNWEYRVTKDQLDSCHLNYFMQLNKGSGRF